MKEKGIDIRASWIVLALSGIMILAGLPDFWVGNFNYWLATRLLYGIGVILFLMEV